MSLRACPKCQHRFYQIMDHSTRETEQKEHYVLCSSCGSLLGTFQKTGESKE